MIQSTAIQDFLNQLGNRVDGDLRSDEYNRILYSTDASIYQVKPYGVLLPKSVEDVQATVEMAARYRIPILPRTGGSSLAGQAINEALIIDMSRYLDRVLEVNEEERWVRVQPGIVLDELNAYLKPYGLKFGPDPASSDRAAMGGIVANNSTGAHSILYGMTADHILECKGFLSDGSPFHFYPLEKESLAKFGNKPGLEGEIYRGLSEITANHSDTICKGTPKYWRRCGGYNLDRLIDNGVNYRIPPDPRFNLAKLICGSEGTLAVMTEIKLNLVPTPQKTALALVHFDTLEAALQTVPMILEVDPSAIELLDNMGLTLCKNVPQYARMLDAFMEGNPYCILITEFYGVSEAELKAAIDRLRNHLSRQQVHCNIVPALSEQQQKKVWGVRKAGLGLLMSVKGDHKPIPFIEDAAVPPEHLAEYISRIEKFCNDLGTRVAYYAHASAGCLHVRPLINTKGAREIEKLPQIASFSAELLDQYGGVLSSEHGDGRCRSWLNERFYGKNLFGLYKQVKTIFDPHNILNPGNIVDPQPMTANLRYGSDYSTIPVKEHLDFSQDQGFHRAVEMCNGSGVCRKRTTDTMCPSFMVTREEEHSTRGRANALRAALSGHLPISELTSKRMYEVLDLCIECKACKAECPSSVDMAKIKFEFLAHYYEANGIPLRSRLIGEMAKISRLSSGAVAPVVNRLLDNQPIKKMMEKFGGISVRRTLPYFAKQPFDRWYRRNRAGLQRNGSTKQVVLFHDTFNTYNDPHIAIAATEVLEAAGYEVLLPGHRCCGRPMISKGLVDKAGQAARDTVEKLAPFAENGIPIVGLEPGCLLSFRDEYFSLLPDDPRVKTVAEHSYMFEEFIATLANEGKLSLRFKNDDKNVLLHGHCHQKALIGTEPSKQTLALPGYAVEEVDSGCCGMAGSFGYGAEHQDISLAMGERRLFPAVRNADTATLIVAAGTSCRHQIADGTGRRALHPVEVLRNALII